MSLANKISYLGETKEEIRKGINKIGGGLSTSDTFRSYADKLEEIYDSLPKVEETSVESGTLDGTIKGGLDITLKGNTSQYTTTGKNKFNSTTTSTISRNLTISADNEYIYLNGTANSEGFIALDLFSLSDNTYSFNIEKVEGTISSGFYAFITSESSTDYVSNLLLKSDNNFKNYKSFTANENNKVRIRFYVFNSQTYTNVKLKYQIVEGSTADYDFEPYTNGSSPNPDYPQPINVVSGDNEINVIGKNLLDTSNVTGAGWNIYGIPNTLKPNTKYTFSIQGTTSFNYGLFTTSGVGSSTTITRLANYQSAGNSVTFTTPADMSNELGLLLGGSATGAGNESIDVIKPQIELGETKTDYEPYNVDTYEIDLRTSKNLFNKYGETLVDKTFGTNGAIIDSTSDSVLLDYIAVKPNTTYTLSGTNWARLHEYNESKVSIAHINPINANSVTITTTSQTRYVRIGYVTTKKDTVQFEKGSSATSYVPYNSLKMRGIGTYEDYFTKNSGKNLLPTNISTQEKNGVTLTNNGDGSYTLNGTATANGYFFPSSSNYQHLKAGTYTFSSTNYTSLTYAGYKDNSGTPIFWQQAKTTFTLSEDTDEFRIQIATTNGVKYDNVRIIMQLEQGNQGTLIEPYGAKDMWCKYNAIGKVVLDGSESWQSENVNTKINYYINLSSAVGSDTSTTCISNYFTGATGQQSYDSTTLTNIVGIGGSKRLRIRGTTFATKSDFTTWLSTHNTIVYYVLANPYLSLIEDETLISQLDNIQNAMSYEGQTNVSQVNNDKAFKLDLKAILDWRNGGE